MLFLCNRLSICTAKQRLNIHALLLELAVDVHSAIKDEQDVRRLAAQGVVNIVSLLKDEATDTAFLVVEVPE